MIQKVNAWFKLLRVPNLLTVPGGTAAGYILNGGEDLQQGVILSTTALLIYSAGLLLNDFSDIDEDRAHRPERPLPSGDVMPATVLSISVLFVFLGIAAAFFAGGMRTALTAALLVGFVVLYDVKLKETVAGPVIMGLCRGMNVLLGASAAGLFFLSPAAGIAMLCMTFYTVSVTYIADRETKVTDFGFQVWSPLIILFLLFGLFFYTAELYSPHINLLFLVLAAYCLFKSLRVCRALYGNQNKPANISSAVGLLIRNMILIQAVFISGSGVRPNIIVLVLILAWLVFPLLGRLSYAS